MGERANSLYTNLADSTRQGSEEVMQLSLFRQIRVLVVSFFLPDALIAIAVAWWLNGGFPEFAEVLIGVKVVYVVIWIKDALWTWIIFTMHYRKVMADALFATLQKQHFPKPDIKPGGFIDPGEYLASVTLDHRLPCELRLCAQRENSTLNTIKMMNGFVPTWKTLAAWDDALKRYSGTFLPAREVSQAGSTMPN
jgi:hypothetical protein